MPAAASRRPITAINEVWTTEFPDLAHALGIDPAGIITDLGRR
jgi:hypothetical protein